MRVIAATGLRVPMETRPREYITDADPVSVEPTAYYIRQVASGDLIVVEDGGVKTSAKRGGK